MGVALQIRNVPEDVRDRLAAAAKERGQSLQSYLLDVVVEKSQFERNAELLRSAPKAKTPIPLEFTQQVIREARDFGAEVDRHELE